MIDILCDLAPAPPQSCCDTPSQSLTGQLVPYNPPGQAHIAYRIGTFASFRGSLLSDLAELLPTWRPTASGPDYATTLVELWAYVADVLTFYQEQVANEAFIGTATRRESLARLTQLIDYRPAPGAAANGLVSFGVAKGKVVQVPLGLQVGSRASGGKPAAKFETEAAITARAEHSKIPLAPMGLVNQFESLGALRAASDPSLLSGGVFQRLLFNRIFFQFASAGAGTSYQQPGAGSPTGTLPAGPDTRTVWFAGMGLKVGAGDFLLIIDPSIPTRRVLRQVVDVTEDRSTRRTAITLIEDPNYPYQMLQFRAQAVTHKDPLVYAMRVRAAAFGANAPLWNTLSPYLRLEKVNGYENPDPPFKEDWDSPKATRYWLDGQSLWLDRVYPGIPPAAKDEASWLVLLDAGKYQVFSVTGVTDGGHSDFTITARATHIDLDVSIVPAAFSVRGTVVLTKSAQLTLDNRRPLPAQLTGSELILDGSHPNLASGQRVIVAGQTWDATRKAASGQAAAEDVLVDRVDAGTVAGTTLVKLRSPLSNPSGYARSSTVLYANVVPVSHGQTIKQEILGSGDGSAWQQFVLHKQPLTYLQSTGGQSPVTSTLEVNVNGVLWREVRDLTDANRGARVFNVRQDDAERSIVEMGDGVSGAAPPTGRDSVKASYRFGQGASGNVGAGAISQLVGSLPGLQSVTNPEPTTGGTDRETPDQIRVNAPGSVRTFGRAISADDYTALALTYPGVARAKASFVATDPSTGNRLARPKISMTVQTTSGVSAHAGDYALRLRAFLDASRDVNVPLEINDVSPVPVALTATIDVEPDHGRKATLAAVIAAMSSTVNADGTTGYFGRLGFGDSVYLSGIYAALQAVDGVADARVSILKRADSQNGDLNDVVSIQAGEIAQGQPNVLLGTGGFDD